MHSSKVPRIYITIFLIGIINIFITTHKLMGKLSAMIAVIFEVFPKSDRKTEYLDLAAKMRPLVEELEGFISVERFQSLNDPNKLLSISFFEDQAAVARWRTVKQHRKMQKKGRDDIFEMYNIKVLQVIRNYGMTDRDQAPEDSNQGNL